MQNQPTSGTGASPANQEKRGSDQNKATLQQPVWTLTPKQTTQQSPAPSSQPLKSPRPLPAPAGARTLRLLLIGTVVGVALAWVWAEIRTQRVGQRQETNEVSGASTAQTQPIHRTLSGAVAPHKTPSSGITSGDTIVAPQTQEAGDTIAITSISLQEPVWAVVYEYNNGTLGRVLGAARFTPTRPNGSIGLIRSTLSGLTYFIGLSADSPDHSYSIAQNIPLLDIRGNQIGVSIEAQ